MGNASSHLLVDHSTLEWRAYTKAEWRSARTRELDELGGLSRPTIGRGKSFQSRLDFLGVQVLGQADEITELFEQYKQGKFYQLNDRSNEAVAQWRIKVHAARRRLILVVWGMIRFRSTIKHRSRLRRVDTFGYIIPLILGADVSKFIAEQGKCITQRAEIAAEAAAATAAAAAAAAAVSALADVAEDPTEPGGPGAPVVCTSPKLQHLGGPAAGPNGSIWLDPPGPLIQRTGSPPDRTTGGQLVPAPPSRSAQLTPPGQAGAALPRPNSRNSLLAAANGAGRLRGGSQNGDAPGGGGLGASRSSSGALEEGSGEGSDRGGAGGLRLPKAAMPLHSASAPLPGGSEVPTMPKIPFSRSSMRRTAMRSSLAGNEPTAPSLLGGGRSSRWSVSGAPEQQQQQQQQQRSGEASSQGSDASPQSDGGRAGRLGRPSRWSNAGGGAAAASASDSEQAGGKTRFNQPARLVIGGYADDVPSPKRGPNPPMTDRPQWNGLHHTARVWTGPKMLSTISAETFQPSKVGITPTGAGAMSKTARLKLPQLGPGAGASQADQGGGDFARQSKERLLGAERSRRSSVVSESSVVFPETPQIGEAPLESSGSGAAAGDPWPAPGSSILAGAAGKAPALGHGGGEAPHTAGDETKAAAAPPPRSAGQDAVAGLEALDQAARARRELLTPLRQLTGSTSRRGNGPNGAGSGSGPGGEMSAADMMLAMYINRCNTTWTAQQEWRVPAVVTTSQQTDWDKNPKSKENYGSALKMVKRGQVAFWFMVGEDSLPTARTVGTSTLHHDVWTSDPYDFIANCRPGLLHDQEDRITKGYSYQSRALGRLAMSIAEVGGKDALAATHVVLSINDEQQEEVTTSLWEHRFYGFARQNVIIVAQSKRPGYRYDAGSQRFVVASDLTTPWEGSGSGISAMQLNWCPDAFVLSADGLVEPILGTTTELLNQREVEWMMGYRARDLVTMEGCLDFKLLAQGHWLHHAQDATMITQVLLSDKMSTARALDSLILNRPKAGNTELRMAELSSHALDQAVERAKAQNNNMVAVGIQRYMFHVPSLRTHLVNNKDFRPKLRLRDGLLFLKYDIADMSCTPGACLAALQLAEQPTLLMSDMDLDMLLAATLKQDKKQTLLNHLDGLRPKALALAPMIATTPKAPSSSGNTTVVFVDHGLTSLPAVRMAVTLSRPGKDVVNLCTFVAEAQHVEHGRAALHQILERLGKAPININVDVLVRGGRSLLEAMQSYVTSWKADLVVIPSNCLSRTEPQALLGSVALAILKRMEVPVLMVTSKATPAANAMYDRNVMRLLVMVEGWTMPLVEYACHRLLQPRKGDKLLLSQVHCSRISTYQQMSNLRHYMSEARSYVESKGIELATAPLLLDGLYAAEAERASRENRINILAVQLPPGCKAVPKHLTTLLCNNTAGLLFMKASR